MWDQILSLIVDGSYARTPHIGHALSIKLHQTPESPKLHSWALKMCLWLSAIEKGVKSLSQTSWLPDTKEKNTGLFFFWGGGGHDNLGQVLAICVSFLYFLSLLVRPNPRLVKTWKVGYGATKIQVIDNIIDVWKVDACATNDFDLILTPTPTYSFLFPLIIWIISHTFEDILGKR